VSKKSQKKFPVSFKDMSDEEVALYAQNHKDSKAQEYLLEKYKKIAIMKSKGYFLVGADRDDIIQEGMIGLYKAIRDFRDEKLASFRAFSEICVTRQILSAIKGANRQKHMPLNSYVSLSKPLYTDGSYKTVLDFDMGDNSINPEDILLTKEEHQEIEERLSSVLSDFEWHVLRCYLMGMSYREMSSELHRETKAVDNALQRVKHKMTSIIPGKHNPQVLRRLLDEAFSLQQEKQYGKK
jgi:RNA polymerase sporulation-specific sigma factor